MQSAPIAQDPLRPFGSEWLKPQSCLRQTVGLPAIVSVPGDEANSQWSTQSSGCQEAKMQQLQESTLSAAIFNCSSAMRCALLHTRRRHLHEEGRDCC